MNQIIIWAGVLVAVAIIVGSFSGKKSKPTYNYRRKEFFMTKAEHEFFDILAGILGDKYYIFSQVHLPSIVDHKSLGQSWKGAFRHIDEKSVDFVVCDKQYVKPLLAIEVDDRSHEKPDRQIRDEEVERILKESDLPLLRFENRGSFNREQISARISEVLK